MSTRDIRIGSPSSPVSVETEGWPSTMRLASKEVPPMSTHRRLGRPRAALRAPPPMVPPTGPERRVCIGSSRAAEAVITPPLDCMTWSLAATPRSLSWPSRLFR
jgi:hypothetical protein